MSFLLLSIRYADDNDDCTIPRRPWVIALPKPFTPNSNIRWLTKRDNTHGDPDRLLQRISHKEEPLTANLENCNKVSKCQLTNMGLGFGPGPFETQTLAQRNEEGPTHEKGKT